MKNSHFGYILLYSSVRKDEYLSVIMYKYYLDQSYKNTRFFFPGNLWLPALRMD